MLKELIKVANDLDNRGLVKEADTLDLIIKEALPHWGDLLKSWGIMGDSANEFLEDFLTGWERRPAVAERLRNRPWYYDENYERMEWAMVSELRNRRTDLGGYENKLRRAMKRIYDSFQDRINREEDSGIPSWDWVQDYDKRSSPKYNNYNGPFVYVADKSGQAPGFRLVDKDGNDWPNYPTESDISKDERFSKTQDLLPGERAGYRWNGPAFKGMHFHLFFEGGRMQLKTEEAPESAPHSGGSHLDRVGVMDSATGGYSLGGISAHNTEEVSIQGNLDDERVQEILTLGSDVIFKKILSDLRGFLTKSDFSQWISQVNAFINNISDKLMIGLHGFHRVLVREVLSKVGDIINDYNPEQSGQKIAEVIRDIDGMA